MAKIRCFLCGGRVSGGVCKECGMPQRQHAQNYYLNESSCDNQPLTHVHNEHDKSKNKNTYASRERRKEQTKGKLQLKVIVVVIIVLLILASAGSIFAGIRSVNFAVKDILEDFNFIEGVVKKPTIWEGDDWYVEIDDSEYDFASYELPETGVFTDMTMQAGEYVVGYHIPEGIYSIAVECGSGDMELDDSNQFVYLYEYLDSSQNFGPSIIYNVRLYDGAVLSFTGDGSYYMTTDNAGELKPMQENTLTDSYKVSAEPMQAGVDFPAGTYDFILHGDTDYISVYILDENGEEIYYTGYMIKDADLEEYDNTYSDYAKRICNINIEEGMYVRVDYAGNVLELVPSEYVVPQEGVKDGEYY